MRRYIIRRILQGVVLLFFISILMFVLLHLIPGGPISGFIPKNLTAVDRERLIHQYGLDQPLPVQYIDWLTSVLHGNLGVSIANLQPVTTDIGTAYPKSIELFLAALLFAGIVAIPGGVLSAVKQYSVTDYSFTFLAYLGIAMPNFWFALLLQQTFGVHLHLLPIFSNQSYNTAGFSAFDYLEDYAVHLVLPMIVLAIQIIAEWSRYLRSSMLDTIKQDYVRTARAKGLGPGQVFFKHALRNALLPLITVVAIDFSGIAGGAVVTESIFSWGGVGQLFFNSLGSHDYPILLALLMIGATAVVVFNLIADILYGVADPRIRYS